jgi:hypothetical protein
LWAAASGSPLRCCSASDSSSNSSWRA